MPETGDQTGSRDRADRSVCAIVVTCNPQVEVLNQLLAGISRQVGAVVVVDNGSSSETLQRLGVANADLRIEWLELGENVGVGAAHNLGIAWARRRGYSFVLLLDHDSIPAANMVEKLLAGYRRSTMHDRVAAVGPAYLDPRTGQYGPFVRFGTFWNRHIPSRTDCQSVPPPACELVPIRTDFLISSGTLIPLSVLDDVGGMDDGLFVDYVDTEWSLRAASLGFRLYGVPGAVMRHTIGDCVRRIGPFRIHEYSPVRLYYNLRNRVLLSRKRGDSASRVRDALQAIRLFLIYGLLTAPRWKNLQMLWRGLRDGRAGRAGRIDLSRQPEAWQAVLARAQRNCEAALRKAA